MSIMDLQRKNFKRGGAGGGSGPNNSPGTTQSGGNANTSTNQGPAGGASSGGDYGGNINPNQTYKSSSTPKPPPKKPKPTKKNKADKGFIKNYFNYHPVISALEKISKNKFNTNQNAKRRERYLNNLLETDPDEYNRVMGQFSNIPGKGIGLIKGPTGIETQTGPDIRTDYGMPSAPPGMLTSNFEEIDGRKSLGDDAALEILGQKYKDTLPTLGSGGGDGNPYILPQYAMMGGGADMGSVDAEPYNQFTYDEDAFGPGGNSADVTRAFYIFNKGGRVPAMEGGIMGTRARRAMGGIMSRVDQRQGYFLGKIVKGIKGAVSGVVDATKKVLKSDLGKAALLAYGAYYTGGKLGGAGGFDNFAQLGRSTMSGLGSLRNTFGLNKLSEGAGFGEKAMKFGKNLLLGYGLTKIPGLNTPKVDQMPGGGKRGGHLIDPLTGQESIDGGPSMRANIELAKLEAAGDPDKLAAIDLAYNNMLNLPSSRNRIPYEDYKNAANGGRIGRAEGGLMNLGGMEKDYRAEGGFVPIGEYEKKDDVPARLSVNEFVFTADAVRGAGQGDIDKGAEIMENMMENLENGGTVSEESQGNKGAQQMFETSQRLGEVV